MSNNHSSHIEYLNLTDLVGWPRNPKDHAHDVLEKSIDRFGFIQPLLIDENSGRLVAGHGRLETLLKMKNMGTPPPKGIKVKAGKWLVPVVRGISFKNKHEAEAYLLADNQTTIAGGYDEKLLQSILQDHIPNLDGLGFTPADIQGLNMPWPEGPGDNIKRGDVTLQSTWIQTESVEQWLQDMTKGGKTLNVCCGMSKIGDTRLDLDPKSNRTEEGDLYNLTYLPGSFQNVVCDPPFDYYDTFRLRRGCKWLVRLSEIAEKRLLVSSPNLAINNLLPRFKASLYAFSDAKKPTFLRLYWCFDRIS